MNGLSSAILFFLRNPAPGLVKSRLAAVLGADAAARLYRAFVLDMLDTVDGTGVPCRVFVHPPDALPVVAAWLGHQRCYRSQDGADLGGRMANAFRAIFAEGCSRAVLIGSDLPDLPAGLLHDSLAALDRNDAVVGPARDGGYYLIGFRRETFLPDIFQGIAWSTAEVFARTMEPFRKHGAAVHVLPAWSDVDTVEDLRNLAARSGGTLFAASRTMREAGTMTTQLTGSEGRHA